MLFMGTNKPVKITDSRSGIIRRLIDVTPSGNKLPWDRYTELFERIRFELGGIAWHCLQVYEQDKHAYDNYIPTSMIGATNDFYNFVEEYYEDFIREEPVSKKYAWTLYKQYCDDAKVAYPYNRRVFQEELKNYFQEYIERGRNKQGEVVRHLYKGFRLDRMGLSAQSEKVQKKAARVGFDWDDVSGAFQKLDEETVELKEAYAQGDEAHIPPELSIVREVTEEKQFEGPMISKAHGVLTE